MRLLVLLPTLLLTTVLMNAQDSTQQAIQAAQQASQDAVRASQQASQDATRAAQQAAQDAMETNQRFSQGAAQNAQTYRFYVASPQLSVKPGTYASPVTVRLKGSSRGSVLYYTLDGWTPSTSSPRYTGPITISTTAHLQAIAVIAGVRSTVASGIYTIANAREEPFSVSFPASAPGQPPLAAGVRIPLSFTAPVTSRGLQIGDKLPVVLAQNLIVGGVVIAEKSTPVLATVTAVEHGTAFGLPGTITFSVHSLTLKDGTVIPLSAIKTKEGRSHTTAASAASLIPMAGVFVHGEEAEIPAGATLLAEVPDPHWLAAGSGPAPYNQ